MKDEQRARGVLTHDAAITALCNCAATVTVLSYQEAIEGYFSLRGLTVDQIDALASPPMTGGDVTQGDREAAGDFIISASVEHQVRNGLADSQPLVQAFRRHRLAALATAQAAEGESFQTRVQPWMTACFGPEIAGDREERNHRFLEEALELVQSCGCTAGEAHQLVDYVFGRDIGEPAQEVGGVMVTLAALCLANGLDMHANGETELARIWTKVEAIRAKQAAKPKHSPLPAHVPTTDPVSREAAAQLVAELAPLIDRAAGPNGWDWMFPLRVNPVDGKPTIVSHKGGNLFRGYIGTWREADLLVALANAAPRILESLRALPAPVASQGVALHEAVERFLADYDDGDRADAGCGPLMESHVADFRAALRTASPKVGELADIVHRHTVVGGYPNTHGLAAEAFELGRLAGVASVSPPSGMTLSTSDGQGVRELALSLAAAHDGQSNSPTKAVTAIHAGVDMAIEYWEGLALAALSPPSSPVDGEKGK